MTTSRPQVLIGSPLSCDTVVFLALCTLGLFSSDLLCVHVRMDTPIHVPRTIHLMLGIVSTVSFFCKLMQCLSVPVVHAQLCCYCCLLYYILIPPCQLVPIMLNQVPIMLNWSILCSTGPYYAQLVPIMLNQVPIMLNQVPIMLNWSILCSTGPYYAQLVHIMLNWSLLCSTYAQLWWSKFYSIMQLLQQLLLAVVISVSVSPISDSEV